MPRDYAYATVTATNGVKLHSLRTRPSNAVPEVSRNNVTLTSFYGINGGFFYQNDLLSIAVVNDRPVGGAAAKYGSGAENVKYARGTLVWDGKTEGMSVQVVRASADLQVTDRSSYWAQGGISMGLGRDGEWLGQAAAENAPFPDDERLRSAAAYDEEGNLYLIVSENRGTLADFREAIVETVGGGKLVDGIFLDGDGSSQLNSRERKLQGDGRPVVEMLRLIR
ncbi:phosphodiester glycosidase family protein [Cohnella faecalis]|uniref:Phosphodiester glycosidase domain-containing protein n=1 Tax=Cohnella faecalis TaxID=2315694 RepID=A0A398CWZ8_9BACL|nr:phosphodiester glycosidase family protein [Cohnella faecalis]RIE03534.1 hypothetical protein D3H35_10815 [Cohnella faecalis]